VHENPLLFLYETDAPNIVIVLMDDLGFGSASTFGGEVNTPTLTRLLENGIAYNEFHTTAICSPTRAALLTGRNHTRVGSGTIAERAVDWDGYKGIEDACLSVSYLSQIRI
jgi:arylsulfatase